MVRICRFAIRMLGITYLFALALLFVGTFGLFGQERDPLAGIFLIPIGLPWNQMLDDSPQSLWPMIASAAPLINIVILWAICRLLHKLQ